jgi:hypothetical protein
MYTYITLMHIRTLRDVLDGPHFTWLDNFSKTISRTVPTLAKGVYSSMLWAGVCIFAHPDKSIDDSVRHDAIGDVIPAMPDNLLAGQNTVTRAVYAVLREGVKYLEVSLVHKYSVRHIPPKIDVKVFPELTGVINNPINSLAYVYPSKLIEENVGSNRGLVSIIRSMYEEWKMDTDECKRYKSMNLDENIYWRVLKVECLLLCCLYG